MPNAFNEATLLNFKAYVCCVPVRNMITVQPVLRHMDKRDMNSKLCKEKKCYTNVIPNMLHLL